MGVYHFTEAFKAALMDYFTSKSVTENLYNHNLDAEFVGNDTVHITEIATTPVNAYDKNVDPSKGSRFGAVQEVGDYQYTLKLTQDISLDRTIDRGNNDAQMNMKEVGKVMKAYTDKEFVPTKDKYRIAKWFKEAGIHFELSAAPSNRNIAEDIIKMHSAMIDEDVPQEGGYLLISRTYVPALQLADQWISLNKLGGETLPKGVMGEFDSLKVMPVSSRRFPKDAYFAIVYPEAVISPEKINTFRGIKDSENLDGDRLQYRCKYDAFVLPNKCNGIAVAVAKSSVQVTPSISLTGHQATITSASADVIYYTLDGSDPRYPGADAKVYSSPVTTKEGQVIKAAATKSDKWMSAVAVEDDHNQ